MRYMQKFLVAACAPVLAFNLFAADSTSDPATIMTERGKLLLSDDFKGPALGKEWRVGKGKWEFADGVLKGSELKSDMHGAVMRRALPFHDLIVQYSFKLDGAKMTTLSINDAKEHVCRALMNSAGFTVQKDDHDHDGPDKAVRFETHAMPLKAGEWYTVVVEIRGKEMIARIGDKHIAYGGHEALDVDKANFGLTVAGESASFKNFRVWEALPKKDWDKSQLAALRKN